MNENIRKISVDENLKKSTSIQSNIFKDVFDPAFLHNLLHLCPVRIKNNST